MFLKKLEQTEKDFGGETKSNALAKNWFSDLKKASSKTKNLELNPKQLIPGKIYNFKYNPITKGSLWYYDKEPLVICLNKTNTTNLYDCINLNFLPKKIKWLFISKLRDELNTFFNDRIISNPFDAKLQKGVLIPETLLIYFKQFGINFAKRSYYINNMKESYSFCYEDWDKVLMLNTFDLEGITESHLDKLYFNYLKNNI